MSAYGIIRFRLTDEQEAAVHELLRRAYFGDGGAAVFAEIRRGEFPNPAGAQLIIGLVSRKAALAIRKAIALEEATTSSENAGVRNPRESAPA